jgi:hypothetical protein
MDTHMRIEPVAKYELHANGSLVDRKVEKLIIIHFYTLQIVIIKQNTRLESITSLIHHMAFLAYYSFSWLSLSVFH